LPITLAIVDFITLLKCSLKKYGGSMWTVFMWLRIGINGIQEQATVSITDRI
jgi:hypothetical protein